MAERSASLSGDANRKARVTKAINALIPVCWPFVGTTMVFTLVAIFSLRIWVPDLFTNFYFHFLLLQIPFAIGLALSGHRKQALSVLPFILICFFQVGSLYIPDKTSSSASSGTNATVKLLQINVLSQNKQYDDVVSAVKKSGADLALLEEVTPVWLEKLTAGLAPEYAVVQASARDDNFGIALFSKIPVLESRILPLGYVQTPTVAAKFKLGESGAVCGLLATHVLPPLSAQYFRERNLQYDELRLFGNKYSKNLIIMGDLNTTSWSPFFQDLIKTGHLHDSTRGAGLQPTWPAYLYPFGIGLEHCLYSDAFKCIKRSVGSDVGSDHLPLIVELQLQRDLEKDFEKDLEQSHEKQ